MVNNVIKMLIITGVFLPLGIFLGCGAVYVFNRLPARWLCDYGEEPAEELLDMSIQRIKGFPNKLMFSFFAWNFFWNKGLCLCGGDAAGALAAAYDCNFRPKIYDNPGSVCNFSRTLCVSDVDI